MSHVATYHPVSWWQRTGKSSQGLENNGATSRLTIKVFYSLRAYTTRSFINRRDCQGDMARWIQKDFQEPSPGYLKDCDLSDLLSEKCSSLDKPMRFGWPGCVGRRKCLVIHIPLELDAQESGRRAELRWKKGLHHNQCYQDWWGEDASEKKSKVGKRHCENGWGTGIGIRKGTILVWKGDHWWKWERCHVIQESWEVGSPKILNRRDLCEKERPLNGRVYRLWRMGSHWNGKGSLHWSRVKWSLDKGFG